MQICVWIARDGWGGGGGERGREGEGEKNAPDCWCMSLTFMNCSRAILSSFFPLCISSVGLLARFPTSYVSAQFFAKAKFYRVDELARTFKARSKIAMNTNCVKKSRLYFRCNITFEASQFVADRVNDDGIILSLFFI